jgi:hypothetical protein
MFKHKKMRVDDEVRSHLSAISGFGVVLCSIFCHTNNGQQHIASAAAATATSKKSSFTAKAI